MIMSPKSGVLPSQMIKRAIRDGWIAAPNGAEIPDTNIQPASLDLRLGPTAHRLRCSFLPDNEPVEEALRRYRDGSAVSTRQGLVLEPDRPYLIPLIEQLDLPGEVRAKANPKSSTGRLDIFTRVISDKSFMFDEIEPGYSGKLYLEVVPRTFPIRIWSGLSLNQLRLMVGPSSLSDEEIRELHAKIPLLFREGRARAEITVNNGLFMALDLGRPAGNELVGYRAKDDSTVIDLKQLNHYKIGKYWEAVVSEPSEHGARIILRPEKFYLLLSQDCLRIPPDYAAEMTAYDPTSGELRTHYAGFFDPGFGFDPDSPGNGSGSRAALEVRAHDVPFAVEHGQNICKLSFDKMMERPDRLYGGELNSNYQNQEVALSKHFKKDRPEQSPQPGSHLELEQPSLFSIEEASPNGHASRLAHAVSQPRTAATA
jgi:dCTP deaminase